MHHRQAATGTSSIEPETWAVYRLLEEVFRLAIKDAIAGKDDAITFLDGTFPDWERRLNGTEHLKRKGWKNSKRNKRRRHNVC